MAQLLVALDFSIVYVALPTIGDALSFSAVGLQWIVSAYGVFFAGFLLLGGRLVDVAGAGRVFVLAEALFAVASGVAGFAPDARVLLACRAAQGIGAALLNPATLGLLQAGYPSGRARDRALAVWGTTGAMGLALGVVVGGIVLSVASWPWIFWINIPIAAISMAAVGRSVGTGQPLQLDRRVDVRSAALATLVVGGLSVAFTELAIPKPELPIVAGVLLGVLGLAGAFVSLQRTSPDPLIPVRILRLSFVRGACAVAALYMASLGAEFYLVTLFLQRVLSMDALGAGLGFLPLALTIAVGNAAAGRLAGRWSIRRLLTTAFLIGALGLGLLAIGTVGGGYWSSVLPGLLVSGIGQGLAFTGMFIAGTRDLPTDAEGIGSAMVTAAQYTGGTIGLALLVWVHGSHPTRTALGLAYLTTVGIALIAVAVGASFSSRRDNYLTERR